MLRFNVWFTSLSKSLLGISIHPMLRFNFLRDFDKFFLKLFQYILCYGSTYLINNNFVGAHKFQYILCYGSTKILIGMIV